MKIEGFGSISSTSNTAKRKGVTGAGNFSELLSTAETEEATQALQAGDVAAPSTLNNLLALQEIPDDYVQRKKLVQHGNNMLDKLEQLRRQLLAGPVSYSTLRDMEREMNQQKQAFNDPKLMEIIEEIELRAAVELAKLQQAALATPVFKGEP